MNRPKVILDAKGLFTHMYHRGNDPDCLLDNDGKRIPTAGWGFVNWLDEYILPTLGNGYHISDVIAVFDGGTEYRTALYPSYKKHREKQKEKTSPVQIQQLKLLENAVKVFLANMGATCVNVDGVEADDTIAALCLAFKDEYKIIHTVDADLLQLVDDKTVVYLKNQPFTVEDPYYKGIHLSVLRLNKTLVGDSSDGYTGVYRFGEKAWEALEKEVDLDGLQEIEACFQSGNFAPIDEALSVVDSKLLLHIMDNLPDAKKCYNLAQLHPELCHQFRGNTLVWPMYYTRVPNGEKVRDVLHQMGCPDYLGKFNGLFPKNVLVTSENLSAVKGSFKQLLPETPYVSFDYESFDPVKHAPFQEAVPATVGEYVDVLSQDVTGASINFGPDFQFTIYIPINHVGDNVLSSDIVWFLKQIEEHGTPLVVQNASFEELLSRTNFDLNIVKPYDTVIMSSYVNENEESGLKFLSNNYLRYQQASYKETLEAAGAKDMSELSGEQVLKYGCDDSLVTSHLFRLFHLIMKMEGTWDFYEENERAPVHVLNDAFQTGVRLDFKKVGELHEKADKLISNGYAQIRGLLAKHCKDKQSHFAEALDEADGANLIRIARYRDAQAKKPGSDDHYLAKRQEQLYKWEEATVYVPYEEHYIPPDFLGTHTQLNLVAEKLGVDLGTGEELGKYALPSIANVRINEWITYIKKEYGENGEIEDFLYVLADAVGPPLKKRQGPKFEALKKFCLPHLGEGKTEKVGDELNFGSPKQMQQLLYCKLGLPVRRRTKVQRDSARGELGLDGSPATDEEAMQLAIAEDCSYHQWKREVLEAVLEIKEQQTMISLYYKPYPLWRHPLDNMVHPTVKNCGTVTRRPAGTSPNLLQVKKGETRTIYLPRYDDHVIVATDFSGQELRIAGSESRDPTLIEAYTAGGTYIDDGMIRSAIKDIHSVTAVSFAETIFQRELQSTDFIFNYANFKAMLASEDASIAKAAGLCRKMAKTVNFLIIYGGSAQTLAMRLGIPESFADELMRGVFRNYARLAPWQEETILFGKRHGFVRTAYGSIKHLTDEIRSSNGSIRSRQERQAVNFTIQGCAADILKVVLTKSYETDLWHQTGATMIAPVYDEIVATVPIRTVFEYVERIQDIMNITPPGHPIPMMAEVSIGPSWGAVQELGDRPSERKVAACIDGFRGRVAA